MLNKYQGLAATELGQAILEGDSKRVASILPSMSFEEIHARDSGDNASGTKSLYWGGTYAHYATEGLDQVPSKKSYAQLEIIRLLASHGVDFSQRNAYGCLPLTVNLQVMEFLIPAYIPESEVYTPSTPWHDMQLMASLRNMPYRVIEFLLKGDPTPREARNTAIYAKMLQSSLIHSDPMVMFLMIEHGISACLQCHSLVYHANMLSFQLLKTELPIIHHAIFLEKKQDFQCLYRRGAGGLRDVYGGSVLSTALLALANAYGKIFDKDVKPGMPLISIENLEGTILAWVLDEVESDNNIDVFKPNDVGTTPIDIAVHFFSPNVAACLRESLAHIQENLGHTLPQSPDTVLRNLLAAWHMNNTEELGANTQFLPMFGAVSALDSHLSSLGASPSPSPSPN